jgi:amino-acid N-acetyltransferase
MLNRCLRNKGADCNIVSGCFITAKKFGIVDSVDYEFTGYPKALQTDRINKFHARNDVVLLTPLGFTKDGDALNVHSEALAAFTAGALEASKLVYFSSKPMILRGSIDAHSKQRLQMITRGIATQIMSHYGLSIDSKTGFPYWGNDIHEIADSLDSDQRSMILKMGWAVHAIEHGVERAHIISSEDGALLEELFTARQGYGTCISQDDYEAPHVKDWNDDLGIAYGLSEAGVVKL